jgi:hypothetical protein
MAPKVTIKIYHDKAYVVMEMAPHSSIYCPQITVAECPLIAADIQYNAYYLCKYI